MVNFRRSYLKLIAVASTMVTVATLAEGWWDSAGQPIRSFSVKGDIMLCCVIKMRFANLKSVCIFQVLIISLCSFMEVFSKLYSEN